MYNTWNLNDPWFDWKRPCLEGFTFKNRGQLGSRYMIMHVLINKMLSYVIQVSITSSSF